MNVCILRAHTSTHKCMQNGKRQEFETNQRCRQRRDFIYSFSIWNLFLPLRVEKVSCCIHSTWKERVGKVLKLLTADKQHFR